jgi:hypothetical protein
MLKISAWRTVLAGTAVELFLKEFCESASAIAHERGARRLTASHLCVFREEASCE